MAEVRAKEKGYAGGMVREQGDKFSWPEGIPLGKWVEPVAFAGRGDHDHNGKTGGTAAPVGRDAAVVVPADWHSMKLPDRKALAKKISGENAANAADADSVIAAYVEASGTAAPFDDAPAPQTVKGNGVQSALGGVEPDWVAPSGNSAGGDDTPVPADE